MATFLHAGNLGITPAKRSGQLRAIAEGAEEMPTLFAFEFIHIYVQITWKGTEGVTV